MKDKKQKYKIGVVDSGVGGLSTMECILRACESHNLPVEFAYFADSEYCPYGNKPRCVVLGRVRGIIGDLIADGCDLVVVACNTATNIGLSEYQHEFLIPIVGAEPAVKTAYKNGHKNTLLLATNLTVVQDKFVDLVQKYYPFKQEGVYQNKKGQKLFVAPQTNLASQIQQAIDFESTKQAILQDMHDGYQTTNNALKNIIHNLLEPYKDHEIDAVVLGCTHYCFCRQIFLDYYTKQNQSVVVYDGNEGIAKRVIGLLHPKQ
ncbi:MAG: aspartate/glutamate racemase family protein [Firmicutes bacterium]|nr:aspartate/glutamate racemase family protein [Bacillota bacterium]